MSYVNNLTDLKLEQLGTLAISGGSIFRIEEARKAVTLNPAYMDSGIDIGLDLPNVRSFAINGPSTSVASTLHIFVPGATYVSFSGLEISGMELVVGNPSTLVLPTIGASGSLTLASDTLTTLPSLPSIAAIDISVLLATSVSIDAYTNLTSISVSAALTTAYVDAILENLDSAGNSDGTCLLGLGTNAAPTLDIPATYASAQFTVLNFASGFFYPPQPAVAYYFWRGSNPGPVIGGTTGVELAVTGDVADWVTIIESYGFGCTVVDQYNLIISANAAGECIGGTTGYADGEFTTVTSIADGENAKNTYAESLIGKGWTVTYNA